MKVQQFRIGNLVKCRGGHALITSITTEHIGYIKKNGAAESKIPLRLVKPVDIIEKRLFFAGFEYNEFHDNYTIQVNGRYHSIKFHEGEWIYSNDQSDSDCWVIKSVENIHQLQNLFFALTGEELKIKL